MRAIRYVLRLRPGGILSLGPPCGSFIWCNLATSMRNPDCPLGDVNLQHVALGNLSPDCISIHSWSILLSFSNEELLHI